MDGATTVCAELGACMKRGFALLVCLLLALPVRAGDVVPVWSDVQPIFTRHCVMCHGPQGAANGLHLDSYAAAVAGSKNGVVVLAGDAAHSELIRRLKGEKTPRMPFLSYPLADDQIALIARWIDAGLLERQ